MLLGCSGEALSELHGRLWIRLSWWALGSSGEAPGMSGDVLDEVLGRLQNLAGVVHVRIQYSACILELLGP